MARPERHDADYFPFIVKDGKTLFILESKYGLQGIGFFTNLMRFLTRQPDHHICVQNEPDRLYFFAQLHCPEDIGMDMLGLMVKTGKIDSRLWNEKRVIVSNDLLDSLEDAYKNRKNKIITLEEIRVSYHNNPITSPDNTAHTGLCHEISGHNPQRILKERILKERVCDGVSSRPVDNSEQIPPDPTPQDEEKPDPLFADLKTIIEAINEKLTPYNQRQVMMFVESNMKGKNHSAITHCLESLLKKLTTKQEGEEVKPRAYLEAALNGNDERAGEDGKHNAEDYIRAAEEKKGNPTRKGMAAFSRIMAEIGGASP